MKRILLLQFFVSGITFSFGQSLPANFFQDSVLGWMKVYQFKGVKKSIQIDHRLYSVAQLSIADSLANWIQASYRPIGGLGDVKKSVSEKLGLYNQNTAAMPQSYGAYAKIYTDLKYNSTHKVEPASNSHLLWSIMANAVYGSPTISLNTPSQYYFTLPSFTEQGYDETLEKQFDLSEYPLLKNYSAYYQRNSKIGNQKTILLCRDNKFPFVKITKGEYLQITATAISALYETEKKKIYENNAGNQKSIDIFMQYLNTKNEKRIAVLNSNKEKYKDRLQEIAEIFTTQPDAMLENYPDVFEGNGGSNLKLPVYKVDPILVQQCKTDKPQWITISWTADFNQQGGKYLHQAIINNFNFEYVYNFFFAPEKVKGKPYRPLLPITSK